MSTSLALGVAGAAIGFFTFGAGFAVSAGFLIGSLIGSLIDPPKVEGPRLGDLKLQVSTFGKMIPYVWGTGRIAGNLIDQTDLQEHKQKSGGKGGPEVTSYTYSASFCLLLCVGPILGIKRIWTDGRLIWSDTTGEDIPCTVYLGDADQAPDPTFEAIHGVGNVPGYNGFAYVVFSDYFLTDFGNRIPQFEFEVFTKVGTFPWRVSHFAPEPAGLGDNEHRTTSYAGGIITVGDYRGASLSNGHYYEKQYDLDGNFIAGSAYDAELVSGTGFALAGIDGITGGRDGLFGTGWYYKENFITPLVGNTYSNSGNGGPVYYNGFIFSTGGSGLNIGLSRWPATGGVITAATGTPDQEILLSNTTAGPLSGWIIGRTNVTDAVYVWNGTDNILYEYSFDLQALNRQWDLSAFDAVSNIVNGAGFTVYQNANGDLIFACDRGNVGGKNAGAFYLTQTGSPSGPEFVGKVDEIDGLTGTISELGKSGYALVYDGVISLVPPVAPELLSTIVDDISNLNGSTVPHDVSELTDEVRWFAIASQMTKRNAIQILRPPFFFDAVESDDVVVFKKRGGTPVFSIPDSSLCGRAYGEDSGDPLRTIRTKEQGLPRTVTMTYYDVDMDYQVGAQSSPRQVTLSEQDVSLDIPVGFTASEALQKSWAIQSSEWIRRERFEWKTTRNAPVSNLLTGGVIPACQLEPCDVGFIRGREIYIETRNEAPNGVITWTGVLNAPSIYTQTSPSTVGGFTPQSDPSTNVPTELVLLDIPILSQHDAPFGFYAAMGPARDGKWPGATLYKSLDGGTTWIAIASTATPAIIGHTSEPSGSPTVPAVLATYGAGDVVDESQLGLRLTDDDAELESITATALTNGANLSALSTGLQGSPATLKWELLGFRDATLVAAKTEVTKGFLRGRKNTATSGHAVGDTFVLLTTVVNVDAPESEIDLSLKYKAVTFGTALADAVAVDFINTGLSADEFFGTEVEHLPPFTGDTGSPSGGGAPGLVPTPPPGACSFNYFLSACGDWRAAAVTDGDKGDVIVSGAGTVWVLDTTGVTPGTYGDASHVPVPTVDAKGRITAITTAAISPGGGAPGIGSSWRGKIVRYMTVASALVPTQVGFIFTNFSATSVPATTSLLESIRYGRLDTGAGANSTLGSNSATLTFCQGNAAGVGGYRIEMTMGVQLTNTHMRLFCGMVGGAGAVSLATDPVNQVDCAFLGCDDADTNLQMFHNDATGTCTKVSLGANFPKTTGAVYRLTLTQVANTTGIAYVVDRLDTVFQATGTLATNLPANTVMLAPQFCIGNGGTGGAGVRLAIYTCFSEQ